MAFYVAPALLNDAADNEVSETIQLRIHSASPGNNGTSARIGTFTVDHVAGEWTDAAAGVVATTVDSEFGVLHASNTVTVTHLGFWRGGEFRGWVTLASSAAVAGGSPFVISGGSVKIRYR